MKQFKMEPASGIGFLKEVRNGNGEMHDGVVARAIV